MPRRRKSLGGNPFQKTANSKEVVVSSVASHEEPPTTLLSMCETKVDEEELFTSMSEMFSALDPDVVYLMLSECDFKGEKKFSLNPLHLTRRLHVLCHDCSNTEKQLLYFYFVHHLLNISYGQGTKFGIMRDMKENKAWFLLSRNIQY